MDTSNTQTQLPGAAMSKQPTQSIHVLMISARADHGGGPRHIELLLRSLPAWVTVYIACPEDDPYWARFKELVNGRLFRIPHRRFGLLQAARLALHVRRTGIQVIHTHGKGAGIYGRIASLLGGAPCVHTPHGIHVGSYGPSLRSLYLRYENISARCVEHLIHVSPEEQDQARELGLWRAIPASVIVNGVPSHTPDSSQQLRRQARRRLGFPESSPVVATVSRFDYQKNMGDAYLIAKAMPHIRFLWIGTGEEIAALQRRAAADGVRNLHFLGRMDAPLNALAAADAYLSTSRWEGLPLAVLEAMSLGIPSVLSNVIGHKNLIENHGAGLLYPAGDIGSAVSALTRVLDGPELHRTLAESARSAQLGIFSSTTVASQTASLYKGLAS
ncbi:glycosyltransferase [Stenotrophomonas sp.]|uniref:glycosyltransferase n=1 Tax=Stenotrophomonas sp. TaxID=69392 RepID=UPI0028ACD6E1|nr:glycosyltransferase [Stenotrophomonas sp.]